MSRKSPSGALGLAVALLGSALSSAAFASDIETLTENLLRLRSEVETLSSTLKQEQEAHEVSMRTLLSRKGELENQIKRQDLEITRLNKALASVRDEARSASADAADLLPSLKAALAAMRAYIQGGLPFKRDERLAALDELETQIDSGVLPAPKGVNRLWSFYEDEMRLTRESGLYRQAIEFNGSSRLADVARLGMMALYYRSDDAAVGMASRAGGDWTFITISDSAAVRQVNQLFDALNKNVRTGYFTLPNAQAGAAR